MTLTINLINIRFANWSLNEILFNCFVRHHWLAVALFSCWLNVLNISILFSYIHRSFAWQWNYFIYSFVDPLPPITHISRSPQLVLGSHWQNNCMFIAVLAPITFSTKTHYFSYWTSIGPLSNPICNIGWLAWDQTHVIKSVAIG